MRCAKVIMMRPGVPIPLTFLCAQSRGLEGRRWAERVQKGHGLALLLALGLLILQSMELFQTFAGWGGWVCTTRGLN